MATQEDKFLFVYSLLISVSTNQATTLTGSVFLVNHLNQIGREKTLTILNLQVIESACVTIADLFGLSLNSHKQLPTHNRAHKN